MNFECAYLSLLRHILENGEDRTDRTKTGTRAIFGAALSADLSQGFPLLTTKKVPFKSVLSELLWFIEGSSDERRLAEILYGTRDSANKTIWTPNAEHTTGSAYSPQFQGDLGRIYGVQWRSWKSYKLLESQDSLSHAGGGTTYFGAKVLVEQHDQLQQVVDKLKNNPTDRRIIMSAWNPGELDEMALPPCHMFVQFYLSNDRKLSAQMYQRSVDTFLGLPFNIASYALLVHMLAHVVGANPGTLTLVLGDTHIYKDHFSAVELQLQRTPSSSYPRLVINRQVTSITDFKMEDFELVGYEPQPHIPAKMSA
jgi:thymidylate synthase